MLKRSRIGIGPAGLAISIAALLSLISCAIPPVSSAFRVMSSRSL